MDGHGWALILAVIALALGIGARLRPPRDGSRRAPGATLLLPSAIIIGTVPWVLQLGETVKIVASITSIVVSVAAVVMLRIQTVRHRRP